MTKDITLKRAVIVHCFIPILIGGLLYISFRSTSLLMFDWYESIGIKNLILPLRLTLDGVKPMLPPWVYYSLPDGLWVYSFTSALLIQWRDNYNTAKIWLSIPFFCGIIIELLQGLKLFPGTFDYMDLLLSLIGLLLSKKILIAI